MLKKFIAIFIMATLAFCLFSCNGSNENSSPLESSEFIASRVDPKTSFKYDEYKDYVIVTGTVKIPDNITIPPELGGKEVKAIGKDAFREMGWVKNITIPDTVVEIHDGAFYGALSAEQILLSENLYKIGTSAFKNALSVKNIRLPLTLKIIGGFAFAECEKLEGISIPKGVMSIGGGAFTGTAWLKKQTDDFLIAGDGVFFHYNGKDEKVTVPEKVKTVSAFYDNSFVKDVFLSDSVTEIAEYSFINSSVSSITSNGSVQKIGKSAFDSCHNLEKITFSDKLEEIGSFAFNNCIKLKEVTIEKNVISIGDRVFAGCTSLEKLTFISEKTQIGESICDICSDALTIYCPKNSPVIDYTKSEGFILDII